MFLPIVHAVSIEDHSSFLAYSPGTLNLGDLSMPQIHGYNVDADVPLHVVNILPQKQSNKTQRTGATALSQSDDVPGQVKEGLGGDASISGQFYSSRS